MEHIFETLETDAGLGVVVDGTMAITGVTAQREEIVRCRDCAHAIRLEGEPAEARPGMLNCVYFSQWDYYDDEPGVWLVEPDGFCAWGRRKEVSDDADR